MGAKKAPFSLGRKSFDSEGLKGAPDTRGADNRKALGILGNLFPRLQALRSVYGISRRGDVTDQGISEQVRFTTLPGSKKLYTVNSSIFQNNPNLSCLSSEGCVGASAVLHGRLPGSLNKEIGRAHV